MEKHIPKIKLFAVGMLLGFMSMFMFQPTITGRATEDVAAESGTLFSGVGDAIGSAFGFVKTCTIFTPWFKCYYIPFFLIIPIVMVLVIYLIVLLLSKATKEEKNLELQFAQELEQSRNNRGGLEETEQEEPETEEKEEEPEEEEVFVKKKRKPKKPRKKWSQVEFNEYLTLFETAKSMVAELGVKNDTIEENIDLVEEWTARAKKEILPHKELADMRRRIEKIITWSQVTKQQASSVDMKARNKTLNELIQDTAFAKNMYVSSGVKNKEVEELLKEAADMVNFYLERLENVPGSVVEDVKAKLDQIIGLIESDRM